MSVPAKSPNTLSSCSEFIVDMIFLSSFCLSVSVGPFALSALARPYATAFELKMVLGTIVLGIIALVSGSQYMKVQALIAKKKAQEKIDLQEAAGFPIAPTDARAAASIIPSYPELLRRNTVVSVFYIPLILGVGGIAASIYLGSAASSNKTERQAALDFLLVLFCVYPIILTVGWRILARFTDNVLLKKPIDLPLSEEQRLKKEEADSQVTLRDKLLHYVAPIVGSIVGIVVTSLPFLIIPSIINSEISSIAKGIGSAALLLGWYGSLLLLIFRFIRPRLQKRYVSAVKEAAETVKMTAIHEETKAIDQAVTQVETQLRIQNRSLESQIMGRMVWIVIISVTLFLFIGVGVTAAIRSSGAGKESAQWGFVAVAGIGALFSFFVLPNLYLRYFMATSKFIKAMKEIEDLAKRGDYAQVFPLIDAQLRDMPSYDVLIMAAAVYAQANHLAEAERLIREGLCELANTNSEQTRDMRKPSMVSALGLLGEIQLYARKNNEAHQSMQQARTFGTNYALENSSARLALLDGNAVAAHSFLDAAAKEYRKQKKQPSPMHCAFRAWAFALQDNNNQAESLIQQALAQVNPEHKAELAEVYLIQGYSLLALHQTMAATQAFQRAIDYDPTGAQGMLARQERERS